MRSVQLMILLIIGRRWVKDKDNENIEAWEAERKLKKRRLEGKQI